MSIRDILKGRSGIAELKNADLELIGCIFTFVMLRSSKKAARLPFRIPRSNLRSFKAGSVFPNPTTLLPCQLFLLPGSLFLTLAF
jgi:hypothetical protein